MIESAETISRAGKIFLPGNILLQGQGRNKGSCSNLKSRGWSCISAKHHLDSSLSYELPKQAYQGLCNGNESLYVKLVLTQIEYLKGPISLQHLCYICDSALLRP